MSAAGRLRCGLVGQAVGNERGGRGRKNWRGCNGRHCPADLCRGQFCECVYTLGSRGRDFLASELRAATKAASAQRPMRRGVPRGTQRRRLSTPFSPARQRRIDCLATGRRPGGSRAAKTSARPSLPIWRPRGTQRRRLPAPFSPARRPGRTKLGRLLLGAGLSRPRQQTLLDQVRLGGEGLRHSVGMIFDSWSTRARRKLLI